MMKRLLELAGRAADAASVYAVDSVTDGVEFANSRFKNIESGMESGVALLLQNGGRLGDAYTRNLIDREGLVQNALASLKGGVEGGYRLPLTKNVPELKTYDEGIERLTNSAMVEECGRVCSLLAERTKAQVNVAASRSTTAIRLLNSAGTDLVGRFSNYFCMASVMYPGTYAAVRRWVAANGFTAFPDTELEQMATLYNASQRKVNAAGGRVRALFMPESMFALVRRLTAATSGKSLYEKVSPLKDRVGQQVLSDKLTIVDEPLDDTVPGARAFDDEGTACRGLPLFEAGVLQGFYHDRFYACKNGVRPTGHGYRAGITTGPVPSLEHLAIRPGSASFDDLLRQMGRGVVVAGVMGSHSGNILNGDYSLGLSPGFWVENGEIVGQVKDAMVAGNVYETMREVVAVEDRVRPSEMGRFPAVLFDNVSLATKA
jgi:PmbA protein